jgi:hypothetical protein
MEKTKPVTFSEKMHKSLPDRRMTKWLYPSVNSKSKHSLQHLTASYKRRKTFVQASNREKRGETDIYIFSSLLQSAPYTRRSKLTINGG